MNDAKPAQIIDLFQAFNADAAKQRSTGEVAAPDLRARAHGTPDHMIEAALATSVERSATMREIAARLAKYSHQPTRADNKVRDELRSLLDCITEGRHVRHG